MQLYLVRHGESVGNKRREYYGSTDYPLTKKGVEDAKRAAEKIKEIKFDIVYTSLLERAYVTADYCLGDRNIDTIKDKRLNERSFGDFEGKTYLELKKEYGSLVDDFSNDWMEKSAPNGETFYQVYDRVSLIMEEIIDKDKDTLIVSHNGTMRAIFMKLFSLNQNISSFYFTQGDYSHIGITKKGNYLVCYNK